MMAAVQRLMLAAVQRHLLMLTVVQRLLLMMAVVQIVAHWSPVHPSGLEVEYLKTHSMEEAPVQQN